MVDLMLEHRSMRATGLPFDRLALKVLKANGDIGVAGNLAMETR